MRRLFGIVLVVLAVALVTAGSASAWWLAQVGADERSLVIGHTNECGRVVWNHTETAQAVVVWESVEIGSGICPAIFSLEQTVVALSQPLAGRHVEGGAKAYPARLLCRKFGANHSCPDVPRLTGLSAADARFLLAGRRLRASFQVVGHTAGLARVTSQTPAAGAELKGRTLQVKVLEHF